jgi:hypothetical protein
MEQKMSTRNLTICSLGALAGAAMLALSLSPASAFTLSGPSLTQPAAAAQIDKVWWRRWGYRPYYYGYRHCWRGYYGRLWCN